jgi:hypothetical protein
MPLEESGLLAAVNTGLAEASASPAPAPQENNSEPENTSEIDAAAPGAGVADGDGDEPGAKPDAAANGEPASVDTDKPAVSTDGAENQADVEGKPVAPAEAGGVKAPDPLNDPLPNALKRETKERIQTLVGMVKENSTKLETVTRERDEIFGVIKETQASPEQFGQALDYLRLINSPNRADKERALEFMQREIGAVARMLGKAVPGVNLLEGHDDLINEVSTGRLSPERAQEIAAARAQAKFERETGETRAALTRQAQTTQESVTEGKRQLSELGRQLMAADPAAYAAKKPILVESLKPVFAQIHPSLWAATFKRAYDKLPAPAPRPAPTPTTVPTNTPLRASNPAGGARPAPKSALEAMEQGIAEAR